MSRTSGYVRVSRKAAAWALWDLLADVEGIGNTNGRRTKRAVWGALVDAMDSTTGRITAGQASLATVASEHAGYRVAPSTVGNHVREWMAAGVVQMCPSGAARLNPRDRCPTYVIVMPADLAPSSAGPGTARDVSDKV